MKINLKKIAIGMLAGALLVGNTITVLASEQVILKEDNGDSNELFDTLSISKVLKKEKLNEYIDVYEVEKGSTLTVLGNQIYNLELGVANIVNKEVEIKEVEEDFWKKAVERKITLVGWVVSEDGTLVEGGTFSSQQAAWDAFSEAVYYKKGGTVTFNEVGMYSVEYAMGPKSRGPLFLRVVEANERNEVEEKIIEESKESQHSKPEQETTQDKAQDKTDKITAQSNSSKVVVNTKEVELEAYNINDNNYIKLRDFAMVVNDSEKQFDVQWDEEKSVINLISDAAYTVSGTELEKGDAKDQVAVLNTSEIYKDGEVVSLTAYTINSSNYFKLRDLAKSFDIGLIWNGTTNTIGIDTSLQYEE